jgi:hypothetical protein
MSDLDHILDQLGVRAQPTPAKHQPVRPPRPPGPPDSWPGIWYTEETVPH